jgi:hypothetical protein
MKLNDILKEDWTGSNVDWDEMQDSDRKRSDTSSRGALPDAVTTLIQAGWNTGRQYVKAGQPINAMLWADKESGGEFVSMLDSGRGVSETWQVGDQYLETENDLMDFVMQRYDAMDMNHAKQANVSRAHPSVSGKVIDYLGTLPRVPIEQATKRYEPTNGGWDHSTAYDKDWTAKE